MTVVADTRFLLVHTFPSSDRERDDIRELMNISLRERLVIPSVVLTEFFKTAGRRIGRQGVEARLSAIKDSGAEIFPLDEERALLAGRLLLKNEKRSIGDSLIAATAIDLRASHVISDDPHFLDFGIKIRWF
jgi:predicted nucleic acid-binding protein